MRCLLRRVVHGAHIAFSARWCLAISDHKVDIMFQILVKYTPLVKYCGYLAFGQHHVQHASHHVSKVASALLGLV
jgi:hypothetical protein